MTARLGWTAAVVLLVGCAQGKTPSDGLGADATGPGAAAGSDGGAAGGPHAGTGATAGGGNGGAGGDPVAAAPGALVITEVMANPDVVTDTLGEWFEVCNVSGAPLPLHGLFLRHDASDPQALLPIESAIVVEPWAYVVLGKSLDPALNGGAEVDYLLPADLSLTNTGDYLAIETEDGVVVDETSWSTVVALSLIHI